MSGKGVFLGRNGLIIISLCSWLGCQCGVLEQSVDAGADVDASVPDGGNTDAGTPDAGNSDAGTPDAGSFDAGGDAGFDAKAALIDGGIAFTIVNYRLGADPSPPDWAGVQQGSMAFRALAIDGGTAVVTVDPSLPLTVAVVCASGGDVEVRLYHVTLAETHSIVNACRTPPGSFSNWFRLSFSYAGLTSGLTPTSWPGWGYPSLASDLVHLEGKQGSGAYPPAQSHVIVERHVPNDPAPRTVDYSTAWATVPFSASGLNGFAGPECHWLTAGGTWADIGPLSQNYGSPVPCAGIPAAAQQPGDVHFLHHAGVGTENFRFFAVPANTALAEPKLAMLAPTVTLAQSGTYERLHVTWSAVAGARGYLFASENSPFFNSTPRWSSVISNGYLAGVMSYTQPDLSSAPGFLPGWNLSPGQGRMLAALVTNKSLSDLIGTAALVPSWPYLPIRSTVLRSGPTTDGLDLEIPYHYAYGTGP
ncbi:MAG: hypothetical protein K1X64_07625 [Myxococcaceae bacterium]|nr:hypothetical protein [Myxococcaceae bacterium]